MTDRSGNARKTITIQKHFSSLTLSSSPAGIRQIARVVREERERMGLTQRELSARAGVGPTTISKLELGSTRFPWFRSVVETLVALEFSVILRRRDAREASDAARLRRVG